MGKRKRIKKGRMSVKNKKKEKTGYVRRREEKKRTELKNIVWLRLWETLLFFLSQT